MRELQRWVERPRPCSYVAERTAQLENRVLLDVTPEEMDTLLARGVRRFGPMFFRPACPTCQGCISLRMRADAFELRRRHRRVLRRNQDLRVSVRPPRVDRARLALYDKWHASRQATRGWEPSPLDGATYSQVFAFPTPTAVEISYWLDDVLVGVALSDATPSALSAIYFFHDPELRDRSLGTLNVLVHLLRARDEGRTWVYLGYWVRECMSLRYKATFGPHEALVGAPSFDEDPVWAPREPAPPSPEG